jgi:hypothetical protein
LPEAIFSLSFAIFSLGYAFQYSLYAIFRGIHFPNPFASILGQVNRFFDFFRL